MSAPEPLALLINAIHYVIYFATREKLNLNATLLLKIIFFAEVYCLDILGIPFTGVKMVKGTYGPLPDGHKKAIKNLVSNNKIIVSNNGKSKNYISHSNPDISLFSKEQLKILEDLTYSFCSNFTAKVISDLTQTNETWKLAEMGREIPLAVFLPNKIVELTPEEMENAAKMAESFEIPEGWAEQ
ncbi:MAG: SocA family protein [Deltaproteobacteria bacterium]|nr:SocA family protein [Deltaproteobacteria bacterium]